MMDVETSYSDFINCDRTGRRNAVPDISGEGAVVASTSELTKDLAEMDLKPAGQSVLIHVHGENLQTSSVDAESGEGGKDYSSELW
uniref:cAMP-dependent protein kinase inhibitor gamma n=1 Tax=Echeneis naucrates TaxID=173247 RepID=A0A665THJ2_ECHNA